MHQASIYPVPRHLVEAKGDAWTKPGTYVGNGAFTLTEWIPNDHVTLVKNPKLLRCGQCKARQGRLLSHIRLRSCAQALPRRRTRHAESPATRRDGLDDAPIIPECLRIAPILVCEFIAINSSRKPFDDMRIREAIALGIDRQTLLTKVSTRSAIFPALWLYPAGHRQLSRQCRVRLQIAALCRLRQARADADAAGGLWTGQAFQDDIFHSFGFSGRLAYSYGNTGDAAVGLCRC